VFQELGQEMGKMNQMGEQIKKLHQVLGGQKLRGNLGEQIMNELIAQIIPFSEYTFQHSFKGGETVDAIIKTNNGHIPIDSKFPLENYQRIIESTKDSDRDNAQKEFVRNVKKHISDIHKKYVRPEEGTVDFALMYVPADSLYFEIIVNNPELNAFAQDKKVYVVSPSVFYSFLQIVLMSYQSQKFEEHAKSVLALIRGVKQESEKFGRNVEVLAKHVGNAKSKMDEVSHGYDKLDLKIQQVSSYEGQASLNKDQQKTPDLKQNQVLQEIM
jgi:DNA recombination protein RmuC